VDVLTTARVRLEDREDDVLLARAGQVLQAHLRRNLDQLGHGFELELRQVHRLTRRGQLRWGDDAYVVGVEVVDGQIVVHLPMIAAAIAVAVVAAVRTTAATATFARAVTGLITEIASHSLLSRNATRSDLRGAPTFWPSTWPFLKRMRVGMLRTLKRCDILGFSSTLSFTIVTLSRYSAAISLSMGAIALHGPHHSAQKSITTGRGAFTTPCSKLVSLMCTIFSLLLVTREFSCEDEVRSHGIAARCDRTREKTSKERRSKTEVTRQSCSGTMR